MSNKIHWGINLPVQLTNTLARGINLPVFNKSHWGINLPVFNEYLTGALIFLCRTKYIGALPVFNKYLTGALICLYLTTTLAYKRLKYLLLSINKFLYVILYQYNAGN